MNLVPVILSNDKEDFNSMLAISKEFASYIQIDFMDGRFVPRKTLSPQEIKAADLFCEFEAHLMVDEPLDYIQDLKRAGAKRVIFHIEPVREPLQVIKDIYKLDMLPGIAVKPFTSVYPAKMFLQEIETLLLLAVDPGRDKNKFFPQVTNKLEYLDSYRHLRVGIDGGVTRYNVNKIMDERVDYVCAGQSIFQANDAAENFKALNKLIESSSNH